MRGGGLVVFFHSEQSLAPDKGRRKGDRGEARRKSDRRLCAMQSGAPPPPAPALCVRRRTRREVPATRAAGARPVVSARPIAPRPRAARISPRPASRCPTGAPQRQQTARRCDQVARTCGPRHAEWYAACRFWQLPPPAPRRSASGAPLQSLAGRLHRALRCTAGPYPAPTSLPRGSSESADP